MKSSSFFKVWMIYVLVILSGCAIFIFRGLKIDTDFLSIFPNQLEKGDFYKANSFYEGQFKNEFLILISAKNRESAIQAAKNLSEKMNSIDLFSSVGLQLASENTDKLAPFLYSKRKALLSEDQIQKIEKDQTNELIDRALQTIYSPTAVASQLSTDPLFLFNQYFLQIVPKGLLRPYQGYLLAEEKNQFSVFLRAQLNPDVSSFNERLVEFYQEEKKQSQVRDTQARFLGPKLFSAFGSETAINEANLYDGISFVGVLVLLIWCFSSLVPIVVCVVTILLSVATGLLAVLLVYPSVHVLSLLLGISVLGIVTDYCTHFFAKSFDPSLRSSEEVIKKVRAALGIGFITNMLTYLCFYFTDLLILKQLSIFTMAAIFTTYLTVIWAFPLLKFRPLKVHPFLKFISTFNFSKKLNPKAVMILVSLLIGVGYFSIGGFRFNDDVKLLQKLSPDLQSDEQEILRVLGIDRAAFYFIVRGNNESDLLKNEEVLITKLSQNSISTLAMSHFVPSLERQEKSIGAYAGLKQTMQKLFRNLKAEGSDNWIDRLLQLPTPKYNVEDFRRVGAWLPIFSNWLGKKDGVYYSVVTISGAARYADLKSAENDTVHLFGKAHDLSVFLEKLREGIVGKFLWVIFALSVVLFFFFRRRTFLILFSPVAASILTLLVCMWFFGYLNLFNILAVLLIFCLGMDYSVFFAQSKGSQESVSIGVFISFLSTVGSFGILGLSSTHAVAQFGLSVFVGICFCYILSPMVIEEKK